MDELLLKFLDQKTTRSEEIAVKLWIESNDDNLLYFQYFADSWNECRSMDTGLFFKSIAVIQ